MPTIAAVGGRITDVHERHRTDVGAGNSGESRPIEEPVV
jgi:hypothetical protein